MAGAPIDVLRRVPLFADLDEDELAPIAAQFKQRTFRAGETVVKEGSGGAAFFLIESGEARVTIRGALRAELAAGDYFGEMALIDEGVRSASITAATDLVCYGLTFWDFRPIVQGNAAIGWKLIQALVGRIRAAEAAG